MNARHLDRPALALLGLAGAALVLLFVLTADLVLARLAASRAELNAFQSDLERVESLKQRLAELETTRAAGDVFLAAPSNAKAVSDFQAALQGLASTHKAEIVSIEAVGSEPSRIAERLRFKVNLTAHTDSLPGLLSALETHRPMLVQDRISIRRQTVFQRFSTDGEMAGERLQIVLELSAFRALEKAPG